MNLLQFIQITPEQLANLIDEKLKNRIQILKDDILNIESQEDLLTREEACKLLQINSSTLWHWQNKGKVKAYGIGNRRYYKRSELLQSLIELKR